MGGIILSNLVIVLIIFHLFYHFFLEHVFIFNLPSLLQGG